MAKASTLASFCTELKSRLLTSRDSAALNAIETDLASHLRSAEVLSQKASSLAKKRAAELDGAGTELWNLCTKLRRELGDPGTESGVLVGARKKLLARCRYFAFLLIDIGRKSTEEREAVGLRDVVHLVRIALKAARGCLDNMELGASLGALQRAAEYIEGAKGKCLNEDIEGEVMKLEVEYFILRTVQVCLTYPTALPPVIPGHWIHHRRQKCVDYILPE